MSDPCKKCGGTDFTSGGRCRVCQKAKNDKYAAKVAGGGKAVAEKKKSKAAKPVKVAPAPQASTGLVIEQGYGLTASIDDAYLILQQHDGETGEDDKVCLSRSEFRALSAAFGKWAGVPC